MPIIEDPRGVTVGELIAILQLFPPETRVTYYDSEHDWSDPKVVALIEYDPPIYPNEVQIRDYPANSYGHRLATNYEVGGN